MLSRQESSLSSSRRQAAAATPPPETHHAKAIGCMSGIIQLFSKYQNRNKRLTFGRKHEKSKPPSPVKSKATIVIPVKEDKIEKQIFETKKLLSCEINVPRSPTLPPEIRRSNASGSPRTPSSLVARLMGLEDCNITVKKAPVPEEEAILEKRRLLLQALEKCNDDLEELKRIILAVQSGDVRLQMPQMAEAKCGAQKLKNCTEEGVVEELSSVCVFDEFNRSPPSRFSKVQTSAGSVRVPLHQHKPKVAKKIRVDDEPIAKHLFFSKYSSITTDSSLIQMKRQVVGAIPPPRSSMAMVQSVEQVCNDIDWGQKREIRRIGLVLQEYLCKDLVEELILEMKSCSMNYSLPLEGCKRRLCF